MNSDGTQYATSPVAYAEGMGWYRTKPVDEGMGWYTGVHRQLL